MRRLLERKSFIYLCLVILIAWMFVAFNALPLSLFPSTDKPAVKAWLRFTRLSSVDFKEQYGNDIESKLSQIDNVQEVTGDYFTNGVRYTVIYDWKVDSDEAKDEVQTVLNTAEGQFPRSWSKFWIWNDNGSSGTYVVGINSQKISLKTLSEIVDKGLIPQIEAIPGIEEAYVIREDKYDLSIELNESLLHKYNMVPDDVIKALRDREVDISLGRFTDPSGKKINVSALRRFKNMSEIEQIVVGYISTKPVYIGDVGVVIKSPKEPYAYFKSNGERAVVIYVSPKTNVNIKTVIDEAKLVVRQYVHDIDSDADIFELLDPSNFIDNALRNVLISVFSGMLIAGGVVFLFFGSFRTSLLICLAMPLSLGLGIILMKLNGISINLLSLGGMALAVGMVVDGAVVVIENIERHFEMNSGNVDRVELTIIAVKEVFPSLLASVLTTIVVFFPLTMTSPIAEAILGDLARVIIAVMLMSLLVSLLFIPRFSLSLKKNGVKKKRGLILIFNRLIEFGLKKYLNCLNYLLGNFKRQWVFLIFMLSLFLLSFWLCIEKLPRKILSEPRSDIIMINLDFKEEGLDFFEKSDLVTPLEERVSKQYPGRVQRVFSRYSRKRTTLYALLDNVREFEGMIRTLREDIKDTIDYEVNVEGWTPTSLDIPDPPALIISVNDENEEKQRDLLVEINDAIQDVDGVLKTRSKPSNNKVKTYTLDFLEDRLLQFKRYRSGNISINDVSSFVSYHLEGQSIGQTTLDGELRDVKVKVLGPQLDQISDVNNILYRIDDKLVPLRDIVSVSEKTDWRQFQTLNGRTAYRLDVRKKDDFDINALKRNILEKLEQKGISLNNISMRSGTGEIDSTLSSLVFALVCSVVLVFLVVVFQFNDFKLASYVLVAIPLGFIGVIFSLMLFSFPLSINSLLGMILLSGTAVNNSIIFIDFYEVIRPKSISSKLAILETAKLRFRPITITVLTTMIGMTPIALSVGQGGEILQPLGVAVTGGLAVSTFLTLLVVPVCLSLVDRGKS